MKIRKYTAQNAQEAIAKVKSELGSEALIINTKKVRQKGLFGYFKKPMTEVMAAVDEQAQAKARRVAGQIREKPAKINDIPSANDMFTQFQSQLQSSYKPAAYKNTTFRGEAVSRDDAAYGEEAETREWAESRVKPEARFEAAGTRAEPDFRDDAEVRGYAEPRDEPIPRDRIAEIETKIVNMEAMLSKVYREVSNSSKIVDKSEGRLAPLTKVLQSFYENLVRNEVEPEFSMNIIEKVSDSLQSDTNASDAATVLYNEVASVLGKPEIIRLRQDGKPTVVIFVGPTGVGKTTTIAKIAADSALNRNLSVALITADTYRIAAVQQLKTYAEILDIPVSVVYSPSEIQECLSGFSDRDLVLIDTAGRSYKNKMQFDELRALVGAAGADEVFLVLSSTTSVRNNREIIGNYKFLDEFKLIFTKADETPVFGAMLNARILTGKCLSYVSIGQSVPDDIEVASVDKITKNLVGSVVE